MTAQDGAKRSPGFGGNSNRVPRGRYYYHAPTSGLRQAGRKKNPFGLRDLWILETEDGCRDRERGPEGMLHPRDFPAASAFM